MKKLIFFLFFFIVIFNVSATDKYFNFTSFNAYTHSYSNSLEEPSNWTSSYNFTLNNNKWYMFYQNTYDRSLDVALIRNETHLGLYNAFDINCLIGGFGHQAYNFEDLDNTSSQGGVNLNQSTFSLQAKILNEDGGSTTNAFLVLYNNYNYGSGYCFSLSASAESNPTINCLARDEISCLGGSMYTVNTLENHSYDLTNIDSCSGMTQDNLNDIVGVGFITLGYECSNSDPAIEIYDFSIYDINPTIDPFYNYLPYADISTLENYYCVYDDFTAVNFSINLIDKENDVIYYSNDYNFNFDNNYQYYSFDSITGNLTDLEFNFVEAPNCEIQRDTLRSDLGYGLRFLDSCDNNTIKKTISSEPLNNSLHISLISYLFLNNSVYYSIRNQFNEDIFLFRMEKLLDQYQNDIYNFSIYENNDFSFIGSSYYSHPYMIDFDLDYHNNLLTTCIKFYDSDINENCLIEYESYFLGVTTNDSLNFLIRPSFDYSLPHLNYLYFDELTLANTNPINWIRHDDSGSFIQYHNLSQIGYYEYSLIVTDSEHSFDEFNVYKFPFFIEKCEINDTFIHRDLSETNFIKSMINAFDRFFDSAGHNIKDTVLWFSFAITLIYLLFQFSNLPFALIGTGLIHLILGLFIEANISFTTTSLVTIGLGLTPLFANLWITNK